MKMRLIPILEDLNPYMQLALDEAILDKVSMGFSPPTIRFYSLKPLCISIGYFNDVCRSVNLGKASGLGIPIIRRITGGGAVVHDGEAELIYSFVFPSTSMSIALEKVGLTIERALKKLGIAISYVRVNDLIINKKKIGGMACARRGGAVLVHGTLMISTRTELLDDLLRVPLPKLIEKGIVRISERVITLEKLGIKDMNIDTIMKAILSEIKDYKIYRDNPTENELRLAEEIAMKYRSWNWLFSRCGENYSVRTRRSKHGKTIEMGMIMERNVIKKFLIMGDFFAYPETAIDNAQNRVENIDNSLELRRVLSNIKAELLGISIDDIVELATSLYKELTSEV